MADEAKLADGEGLGPKSGSLAVTSYRWSEIPSAEQIPQIAADMASKGTPEGYDPSEFVPVFQAFLEAYTKDLLRQQAAGELLHRLIAQLSDIEAWKTLEARSRQEFRAELNRFLSECRRCLNLACKIEAHRRADQERNDLILHIKGTNPKFSFGQVAIEYRRQTAKPMTAKNAERIFKRSQVTPPRFHF